MLSDQDRALLRQWQANPELTPSELAERLGLRTNQVTRRIAKLRERGILRAVRADIHWPALGYEIEVSLRITLDKTDSNIFEVFSAAARKVPEIIEIQTFLGQVDVRLSIIARDLEHYQQLYRDAILALPGIADIEALLHIARVKTDRTLPV